MFLYKCESKLSGVMDKFYYVSLSKSKLYFSYFLTIHHKAVMSGKCRGAEWSSENVENVEMSRF